MAPTAGFSVCVAFTHNFEPASFSLFGNPNQTGVTVPNAGPSYTMWAYFFIRNKKLYNKTNN